MGSSKELHCFPLIIQTHRLTHFILVSFLDHLSGLPEGIV